MERKKREKANPFILACFLIIAGLLCFTVICACNGANQDSINANVTDKQEKEKEEEEEQKEEGEEEKQEEEKDIPENELEFALFYDGSMYHKEHEQFFAWHEGWVYCIDYNIFIANSGYPVFRMSPDGSEKLQVLDNHGFTDSVFHDGWLYYLDGSKDNWQYPRSKIYRMRLDGSEKTEYWDTFNVRKFSVYEDWIYYTGTGTDTPYGHPTHPSLFRINIDGSKKEEFHPFSEDFLIDGEYFFMIYSKGIERFNLDFTDGIALVEGNDISHVFAVSGYLYFKKGTDLCRIKYDGTEQQTVIGGSFDNFILQDDFIYYSMSDENTVRICRISANGGQAEELYTYELKDYIFNGFFIDNNSVYIRIKEK